MANEGQLREVLLERLSGALARPSMYARNGGEFELLAGYLVADLCLLDGRKDEGARVVRDVREPFGKVGLRGPFRALFPDIDDSRGFQAEVVSLFAQIAHRLGYLDVAPIPAPTWDELAGAVRERFEEQDFRRGEIREQLGEPSFVVRDGVDCYVREGTDAGWIFFDYWERTQEVYEPSLGFAWQQSDDPLLREVRFPAESFETGLVLTHYGEVLRWGAGWWLRHPSYRPSAQPGGQRQLREIDAADPSQSLRSRLEVRAPVDPDEAPADTIRRHRDA